MQNRDSALANLKGSSSAEPHTTIKPTDSSVNTDREIKPAPVYVRHLPTETVISLVKSAINNDKVNCTNIRQGDVNQVKVQCTSIDDYRKVINHFDNSDVKYYTYELKILRGLCLVIKGIEVGVDTDEIMMELEKQNFSVSSVTNIINRETKPQPLYRVELEPCTVKLKPGEVHPIYNLRYLINRVISVEEPHKRIGPVQCTNC